jgi:hypothetical protein
LALTDIPFIGAITISFLNAPEIDFDLVIQNFTKTI